MYAVACEVPFAAGVDDDAAAADDDDDDDDDDDQKSILCMRVLVKMQI